MNVQSARPPVQDRTTIDGKVFFSRSPLRSGYFLLVTLLCAGGIAYALILMGLHWQMLTANRLWVYLFFLIVGFIGSWQAAMLNFERLRRLSANGVLTNIPDGSPLYFALGTAALSPTQTLFYAYLGMIAMEGLVGHLMKATT